MNRAEFFVPGEPKAQTRPRTFRLKGGGVVTRSSSARVSSWRERVHVHALPVAPARPPEGPVTFTAVFLFRRPDGHYRKCGDLSSAGLRSEAPLGGKGDWDNLGKAVCDALEGLFFRRDSQITQAHVAKAWCGRDEQEGVAVTVRWGDPREPEPKRRKVAPPESPVALGAVLSRGRTRQGTIPLL